jgi:spore maturation protein SpmA
MSLGRLLCGVFVGVMKIGGLREVFARTCNGIFDQNHSKLPTDHEAVTYIFCLILSKQARFRGENISDIMSASVISCNLCPKYSI